MSDFFLGEIRLMPIHYEFDNSWLLCDGRTLQIQPYTALYSLLGVQFGGDGRTTFMLPDLRGRVPVGQGYLAINGQSTGTAYVCGKSGGAETVTLTAANMPPHTHLVTADDTNGASAAGNENYFAKPVTRTAPITTQNLYVPAGSAAVPMNPAVVNTVGGGGPHNNMQPFGVLAYFIASQGVYPPRS